MSLILFGFKRCGKTHFGMQLAKALQLPFIDTDSLIEKRYAKEHGLNLSCREICNQIGIEHFRRLESQVIQDLHTNHFKNTKTSTIISLGGGAVLEPKNVQVLKQLGTLVYLELDKETLRRRVLDARPLPSFIDPSSPLEAFEEMYTARLYLYEKIEAVRIDLSKKTESEILNELLSLKVY